MNDVKELVEELRNKKSRDNRELLDRSADMIERLAKELCEKSGCHHKCHDTKDCVVEDEAELLINENKSNNFDVKSNNELFKQALVEGVNRRFDREIEEAKKIEQIEGMAKVIFESSPLPEMWMSDARISAEVLYNEGYRKQSEGEWIDEPNFAQRGLKGKYYICTKCNVCVPEIEELPLYQWEFCPNCGAKMKGGEE